MAIIGVAILAALRRRRRLGGARRGLRGLGSWRRRLRSNLRWRGPGRRFWRRHGGGAAGLPAVAVILGGRAARVAAKDGTGRGSPRRGALLAWSDFGWRRRGPRDLRCGDHGRCPGRLGGRLILRVDFIQIRCATLRRRDDFRPRLSRRPGWHRELSAAIRPPTRRVGPGWRPRRRTRNCRPALRHRRRFVHGPGMGRRRQGPVQRVQ